MVYYDDLYQDGTRKRVKQFLKSASIYFDFRIFRLKELDFKLNTLNLIQSQVSQTSVKSEFQV